MNKQRATVANEIREILEQNHAMISDAHLVLTNGKHSSGYIDLRQLAGKVDELDKIGSIISDLILERLLSLNSSNQPNSPIVSRIDGDIAIIGPETIGRSLAHATAAGSDITNIMYAWCRPNDFEMQWDLQNTFINQIKGRHCFIVDDVLVTTKITKTAELIRATGGIVAGAIVIIRHDPNITAKTLDLPWLETLLDIDFPVYPANTCPLCQQKVPMWAHLGHGQAWLKNHPNYPVKEIET